LKWPPNGAADKPRAAKAQAQRPLIDKAYLPGPLQELDVARNQ